MAIIRGLQSSASVPTPATGEVSEFFDTADGKLKKKDSTGAVTVIEVSSGAVNSVFGRSGSVTAQAGDYEATEITNTPAGDITSTTVQDAINELDIEKAPIGHVGSGGVTEHALATGAAAGFLSPSDKTKLDGIASGATANDTDANLKNRANHTGTQAASTISDFTSAADARVTSGISAHTGASDPHPQYALDSDVTAAQAYAVQRANHTGTQTASTISDFTASAKASAVQDAISNGITDIAPSQNAVFDALATKTDVGHTHTVSNLTDYAASQALKANKSGDTFTGAVVVEGDNATTGVVELKSQSGSPATPASGVKVYANVDERFTVKGQSSFAFTLDDQFLTQDRTITIPDADAEMLLDPTNTTGDIIYRGPSGLTRLPIGATDQLLSVSGGVPFWRDENLGQDFGGGSDGNATISGVVTLTNPAYYDTLTLVAGGAIITAGYPLYAKTLNLSNCAPRAIRWTGNNGTNSTSAAGTAGGTLLTTAMFGGAGGGGTGATATAGVGAQAAVPGNASPSNGGAGGAGGLGGSGAAGSGGAVRAGGTSTSFVEFDRFEQYFLRGATPIVGGAPGAGGSAGAGDGGTGTGRGGAGGGSGGGVVAIYCETLITSASTPSDAICATGGNGGSCTGTPATNAGGGAGGGGGGGGYVYLAYLNKVGATVTNLICADGGNGGNGGVGVGTGTGGAGGSGGNGGRVRVYNAYTATSVSAVGTTGSAGTAASGTTGGSGGAGGIARISL